MGAHLHDDFLETMVGRATFSVVGKRFDRIGALAPKGYLASYEPCEVRTTVVADRLFRVPFAPMHVFLDTFHLGAWEGAARFCGAQANIRVDVSRPDYGELEVAFR